MGFHGNNSYWNWKQWRATFITGSFPKNQLPFCRNNPWACFGRSKSIAECVKVFQQLKHSPRCALHTLFGLHILPLGSTCISWAKKFMECATAAYLETWLKLQRATGNLICTACACFPVVQFTVEFPKQKCLGTICSLRVVHTQPPSFL